MKNHLLIILSFCLTLMIQAQEKIEYLTLTDEAFNAYFKDKSNIPVVKGKILNLPASGYPTSITYTLVTPLPEGQLTKNTNINPDGTFELELDYPFPIQQIWVDYEDLFYAGIYAHSDLMVELDYKQLVKAEGVRFWGKGIQYLGSDGPMNAYFNKHVLYKRKKQLDIGSESNQLIMNREMDEAEFIQKHKTIFDELDKLDNEFIKKNPSPYAALIKNERKSQALSLLSLRYINKEMPPEYWNMIKNHNVYLVSNDGTSFYTYLKYYLNSRARKDLKIDWEAYASRTNLNAEERQIIDSVIHYKPLYEENAETYKKEYNKYMNKAFSIAAEYVRLRLINLSIAYIDRQFPKAKADFLKFKLIDEKIDDKKLVGELLINSISTPWCKEVLTTEYRKATQKIDEINEVLSQAKALEKEAPFGKPVTELQNGAKLYQASQMTAEEFLTNLKQGFPDKALLIDCWATWCAPCINEMPHSNKLHKETTDLPIEFVYLCTSSGSNMDRWKSKVVELGLNGTHVFVDKPLMSEFMSLFSKSGFPSYLFINKEGKYLPNAISRMSATQKEDLMELTK